MPTEKYTAHPTVEPEVKTPDDYSNVQANPERFAAAARGLQQAGKSVEETADLWGQLQVDAQVNETLKRGDELVNHMRGLHGQEQIDFANSLPDRLNQLTEQGGQGLPPVLKHRYNSTVLPYGRRLWNGEIATSSAKAAGEVANDTYLNTVKEATDRAARFSNDPEGKDFQDAVKDSEYGYTRLETFKGNANLPGALDRAKEQGRIAAYTAAAERIYTTNKNAALDFVRKHESEMGSAASVLEHKYQAGAEKEKEEQKADAIGKIYDAKPEDRPALIQKYAPVLGDTTVRSLTGQPAPTAPGNVPQNNAPRPGETPGEQAARQAREAVDALKAKTAPAIQPTPPLPRQPGENYEEWKKRDHSQNFSPAQNFAATQKGNAASGAIEASLQKEVDAHADKNLFSSGMARRKGIEGGIGQNLVQIANNPEDGAPVKVNARAAPHFKGFLDELQSMGYKINSLGGYDPRHKVGGFGGGYSEHAFGNAIDINPNQNPQSGGTNLPPNVGAIAARYGLIWGGDWSGRSRDPMHFEWSGKETQVAGQ